MTSFTSQSRPQMTISFVPPKPVVLVGLMGSGKTSIGRRLSKRFEFPFYDSDQEIELAAGRPIKDIYNDFGEDAFNQGEYKVIKRLLSQGTHVLATGGSSFAVEQTRAIIKEKAISVWLKADLPTLVARVSRRSDRPLLANGEPEEILRGYIERCYPLYEEADVHVDTFDEPTSVTVDRVIQAISEYIRDKYSDHCVLKTV